MITFLIESEPIRRGTTSPYYPTYLLSAKQKAPNRVLFLFANLGEGDSKATVKKTCRRHVFRESADDYVSHRK